MGKRKGGGLTGLSRFVLESLKDRPTSQPISPEPEGSQHPGAGILHRSELSVENRPAKRRKTKGSIRHPQTRSEEAGPWIEKYDATGLVPHYAKSSEVPDHLQKCGFFIFYFYGSYLYLDVLT